MSDVVELSTSDYSTSEDSQQHHALCAQHVLCPITPGNWFSTDHLTLYAEYLNSLQAHGQGPKVVFCAARGLPFGSIPSLRFAAGSNKLHIMPFQDRSHFFLAGVEHSSVRYFLDPMTMDVVGLSAFQKGSIRKIQLALDGGSPNFKDIVTGSAAWQQLTGCEAVQPQTQDAAAGDGYNCGPFCCMYMWEVLHQQPWPQGSVAQFRQHVGSLLNCWQGPAL